MRILLDQNVPDSVAQVFQDHGHEVIFLRDILPTDTPDEVVADVSETEGAVLVSCDGDFRRIAPRVPHGERQRFRNLSRIHLQVQGPHAARRIEVAMSFIEAEYEIAQNSDDTRMILAIRDQVLRTHR